MELERYKKGISKFKSVTQNVHGRKLVLDPANYLIFRLASFYSQKCKKKTQTNKRITCPK